MLARQRERHQTAQKDYFNPNGKFKFRSSTVQIDLAELASPGVR